MKWVREDRKDVGLFVRGLGMVAYLFILGWMFSVTCNLLTAASNELFLFGCVVGLFWVGAMIDFFYRGFRWCNETCNLIFGESK